jgi:hypothetical protein
LGPLSSLFFLFGFSFRPDEIKNLEETLIMAGACHFSARHN